MEVTVVRKVSLFAKHVPETHREGLVLEPFSWKLYCSTRLLTLSLLPPILATPERSPFISAANTGTPMSLNVSERVCSVTVFPFR